MTEKPDVLTFAVNTDIDAVTGTAAVYVQETSREPGVNVRVTFDPTTVSAEYMMTVVDAMPTVLNNYVEDVVKALDGEGLI